MCDRCDVVSNLDNANRFEAEAGLAHGILRRNRHSATTGRWYGPDLELIKPGPHCKCQGCLVRYGKKEEDMVHEIRVVVDEEDIRKKIEVELEKFRQHGEYCVEIGSDGILEFYQKDSLIESCRLSVLPPVHGHFCGFKQKEEPQANLGMATTEELIKELRARGEVGSFGDSEVPRHQYLELAMDSLLGVLPDSILNYSTWTDSERPSI